MEEEFLDEDGRSAEVFCAKRCLCLKKDVNLPRLTRAAFVQQITIRILSGFSEIEAMQPVRYGHLIDLPVGLDYSRFR